jgi:hypothetical protein
LFSFPTIHSAPLHQLFSLPLLSSSNLSPHYPCLLHTRHLLTSLLYQLHTTPAPYNPWHKHSPLQQQKYTQIHIRATNTAATKPLNTITHSFSHPPHFFSATFINSP